MQENYYRGLKEHPYHLSVGAVLVNKENKICCHYFKEFQSFADRKPYKKFYILMRETLELNETLEQAVYRGLKEEFGAKGKIKSFLGSINSTFKRGSDPVEKITLYFLVDLLSIGSKKRHDDAEAKASIVQWHSFDFLINKMKKQGQRYERTDLDESIILERAKECLKNQ